MYDKIQYNTSMLIFSKEYVNISMQVMDVLFKM